MKVHLYFDFSGRFDLRNTVLIVDDDQRICSALKLLLVAEGLDVQTSTDGENALRVFEDIEPDLVLLDVVMPGVDGLEVCRRLKNNPDTRLTPIVLLTGLGDPEDRVRGIEAGADDFLSKPFEHSELLARVRSLLRMKHYTDELERAESVLFVLAETIEGRDTYTQGHGERLSRYSAQLGVRLGLTDEEVTALRHGGIVHDLGKVAVPDAVLLKPGRLTREEFAIMREHPVVGERICRGLHSFKHVLPIIRHHHEKLDGSGYPDGLIGEESPITARVMSVVDVFDALTTDRPYRVALSVEEALATLQNEADMGWWDLEVLAEFRKMIVDLPTIKAA